MKGYIVDIGINDRREKTINLNQVKNQNEIYIIETHKSAPVAIVDFKINKLFKSVLAGFNDLKIADLQINSEIFNEKLFVKFCKKTPIINDESNATIEEKEENIVYSYEDLDQFRNPLASHTPSPNTTQIVDAIAQTEIGKWQNFSLIAQYHEKIGYRILAQIDSNYDSLLDKNYPKLVLDISLDWEGELYAHTLELVFAHKEQYLGLALDFGSESSQMAYNKVDESSAHTNGKPQIENLYKNIVAFHKNQKWLEGAETSNGFYQEEPNTNFYKSIFFLREDLSGEYQNIYKDLYVQEQKDNLKMLVNTHDGYDVLTKQHFHQLPNLKITHKYNELFSGINFNIEKDGYPINVPLGVMKGKVYNSILKVIIHSYIKKEFILSENSTKKIRFIILVPNIYDQESIISTENIISTIFQDLKEEHYQEQLLAWEVLAISESDASFLGYINKNNTDILPNRDYIIIDSGKGTTDLSIIKTGKQNLFNIDPVFRNGFAGAGNLISFAVFETLIHYIRANSEDTARSYNYIKNKIISTLNSNDLALKNRFYREIERLKYNYTNNQEYASQQWKNARNGDISLSKINSSSDNLDALSDILRQIDCIYDFYGYIGAACEMIAQRTVSYIKLVQKNSADFNLGGVLLTGRAFLFEPLEKATRKALSEVSQISDSKIQRLNGSELKDICIKGVFNKSVKLNAEKIGYPIQYITHREPVQEEVEVNVPEKKKKTLQERILKVFYGELQAIENAEIILTTDQKLVSNKLYQSQILIGPKRYKVSGNSTYDAHNLVDTDIIFTPEGYIVRNLNQGKVLDIIKLEEIYDAEDIEMNMVIPSLFPNYIQENFIYSFKRSDNDFVKSNSNNSPLFTPPTQTNNKPKGPIYF